MFRSTLESTLEQLTLMNNVTEAESESDQSNEHRLASSNRALACTTDRVATLSQSETNQHQAYNSTIRSELHPGLQQFHWAHQLFAEAARLSSSTMTEPDAILDNHLARVWRRRAREMAKEDQMVDDQMGQNISTRPYRSGRRQRQQRWGLRCETQVYNRTRVPQHINSATGHQSDTTLSNISRDTISSSNECILHMSSLVSNVASAQDEVNSTTTLALAPCNGNMMNCQPYECSSQNEDHQHYHEHQYHHRHHHHYHHHHYHHHHYHYYHCSHTCGRNYTYPCENCPNLYCEPHPNSPCIGDKIPLLTFPNNGNLPAETICYSAHETVQQTKTDQWGDRLQNGMRDVQYSSTGFSGQSLGNEYTFTSSSLSSMTGYDSCVTALSPGSQHNASMECEGLNNTAPSVLISKSTVNHDRLITKPNRSKSLSNLTSESIIHVSGDSQTLPTLLVVSKLPEQSLPHIDLWNGTVITLREYKILLGKKLSNLDDQVDGKLRYFFKCTSSEFFPGLVYEELHEDTATCPLWAGLVWGNIEYS